MTKEQAKEILWNRCQHTSETAKAIRILFEERPQSKWIVTAEDNDGVHRICCPFCSYEKGSNNTDPIIVTFTDFPKFCENCGADMRKGDTDCMDEDAKQASIPYTYNAPQHDWKCGYPDITKGKGGAE